MKPQDDLEISIGALDVYGVPKEVIRSMKKNLKLIVECSLNVKQKQAFSRFVKKNPDATSADHETWFQVWEELVKLFNKPIITNEKEQILCDCGNKLTDKKKKPVNKPKMHRHICGKCRSIILATANEDFTHGCHYCLPL